MTDLLLEKLIVAIEADTSKLKSGMESASKTVGNFGAGMSRVGTKMTMGITAPIAAAGAASVKMASDLNESVSKAGVVFGQFGDDVMKWSENSAQAFGMSKQQALEAAGTYGNLFVSMGMAEDMSKDMSTSMVELAADLASFNNTSTDEALNALRSGLVGETEPLKRFGVNLNEATLKQKALEMGLSDGKSTLDANTRAQAAYALIMEQTATAQGDFARTSDGMANSQRILKADLSNLAASMGTYLLPAVTSVIRGISSVVESFGNLGPGTQKAIIAIAGVAAAIGPTLIVFGKVIQSISAISGAMKVFQAGGAFAKMGPAVGKIGGIFTKSFVPAIGKAIASVWSFTAALLANPITWIVIAVMALIAAIILLWKNWDKVTAWFKSSGLADWFSNLWDSIKSGFDSVIQWFVTAWDNIKNVFKTAIDAVTSFLAQWGPAILAVIFPILGIPLLIKQNWDKIVVWLGEIWNVVVNVFNTAIGTVKTVVSNMVNSVVSTFQSLSDRWNTIVNNIKTFVINTFNNIKTSITDAVSGMYNNVKSWFDKMIGFVSGMPGRIMSYFKGLASSALNTGRDFVSGLWNGIKEGWNNLISNIKGFASSIGDTVKSVLGISSPSKVGIELGSLFDLGIAEGINKATADVISSAADMAKTLADSAMPALSPSVSMASVATTAASMQQTINHTGTIRVEGVNDEGQLTGVVDIIIDRLRQESRTQ